MEQIDSARFRAPVRQQIELLSQYPNIIRGRLIYYLLMTPLIKTKRRRLLFKSSNVFKVSKKFYYYSLYNGVLLLQSNTDRAALKIIA